MKQVGLSKEFLEILYDNKSKLDKGVPTLIPFPYSRLSKIIPGVERGAQVIVTGNTGSGCKKYSK